jgi:hypothetical protein
MGKFLTWVVVLLICFSSLTYTLSSGFTTKSPAQITDTTIQGVLIENNYSPGIFPDSWREAPINAEGENMSESEIKRTKAILAKALVKYPQQVLQENLHSIYLLRSMKFYNLGYGGTNSTDALYLTSDGVANGYTDRYLEQTFHHEFSSILYRNYPELLDTVAWINANLEEFESVIAGA